MKMDYSFLNLQRWFSEGESPVLEFKSSVERKVGETISAFANSSGGIIVFGIDMGRKEFPGLKGADEESRRVRQILEECKPIQSPIKNLLGMMEKHLLC